MVPTRWPSLQYGRARHVMLPTRQIGHGREVQVRHALGHRPARRVGAPSPTLLRNRAHQLVKTGLCAGIFVGDELKLAVHAGNSPVSSLFPANAGVPPPREHIRASSPVRARTPPPRPAPDPSSPRSAPG